MLEWKKWKKAGQTDETRNKKKIRAQNECCAIMTATNFNFRSLGTCLLPDRGALARAGVYFLHLHCEARADSHRLARTRETDNIHFSIFGRSTEHDTRLSVLLMFNTHAQFFFSTLHFRRVCFYSFVLFLFFFFHFIILLLILATAVVLCLKYFCAKDKN